MPNRNKYKKILYRSLIIRYLTNVICVLNRNLTDLRMYSSLTDKILFVHYEIQEFTFLPKSTKSSLTFGDDSNN